MATSMYYYERSKHNHGENPREECRSDEVRPYGEGRRQYLRTYIGSVVKGRKAAERFKILVQKALSRNFD